MPELGQLGRLLMIVGVAVLGLGLLLTLFGRWPGLGHLPGDIVIRRGNFALYFPLATSILLSLILTLIFRLFRH